MLNQRWQLLVAFALQFLIQQSAFAQSTGLSGGTEVPDNLSIIPPESKMHASITTANDTSETGDKNDGEPEATTICNQAFFQSPLTGKMSYKVKSVNEFGDIIESTYDENGEQVPNESIILEMEKAYKKRNKLSPSLIKRIATAKKDEKIAVIVWCRTPDGLVYPDRPDPNAPLLRLSPAEDRAPGDYLVEGIEEGVLSTKTMQHAVEVAEELKRLGTENGIEEGTPIVFATLSKAAILEVSKMENVLEIYADEVCSQLMDSARRSTRAHIVNNRGYKGNGIKVGVVEVGGKVNRNHPYLNFFQRNRFASIDDHAAGVAGAIASRHPVHKGIASNAKLFLGGSASGRSSELIKIMHDSRRWGADIINNSWGREATIPGANARACDHIAIRWFKTIVIAAGNSGRSHGYVGSPGSFYNGITVGATDNRNTGSGNDDRMAPYSSFRNPSSPYGDRQKPDLVAPGGNVQEEFRLGLTTLSANSSAEAYSAGPWLMNTSGTSFSSPVVAGGAALLMQRSRRLKQWPEAVKAILAATAMQNVEGDPRQSEYDGAGSIMLDRADHAAGRRGNAGWSGIKYNFNRPVTLNLGKTFLVRGKRARVAIAWNQNPNYSLYSSMPCADLDLQIILPNGSLYTGSYSYDNNLEIVDFRPPTSGNYTIRVKRVRMDMSPRYLGFAWYQEP